MVTYLLGCLTAGGLIGILVLVQFMQDGDDIPLWKRD